MFKKIKENLSYLSKLIIDIRRGVGLAYEIDSSLVIKYYFFAFIGAISPILAAILLKFIIDILISDSVLPEVTSLSHMLIYLLAGYFLIQLSGTIFYWGLNVAYLDYLLRNKLQNGLIPLKDPVVRQEFLDACVGIIDVDEYLYTQEP